jgi:hypothetical protein
LLFCGPNVDDVVAEVLCAVRVSGEDDLVEKLRDLPWVRAVALGTN